MLCPLAPIQRRSAHRGLKAGLAVLVDMRRVSSVDNADLKAGEPSIVVQRLMQNDLHLRRSS